MKIIFVASLGESFLNFRRELISDFVHKGFEVICISPNCQQEVVDGIESIGARFIGIDFARGGLNPFPDAIYFIKLYKTFFHEKPDYVFAYTIKPIIWSGIAAALSRVKNFTALVTGLGYSFQSGGIKRNMLKFLVKNLYKLALSSANKVIFQNNDNKNYFISQNIVDSHKAFVVNGSGVDLSHFDKYNLPNGFHFLMVARLLFEKGVREYVEASTKVKALYPQASFSILGGLDPSPDGLSLDTFNRLNSEMSVTYLGTTNDVRSYIRECSIFVLPSYHEGLPRSTLEALAVGRPILTTDVPGCRETVVEGNNGWLVEKANAAQLADKMIWFIENKEKLQAMCDNSRRLAVDKFDVIKVNRDIFSIMDIER
jgi:glycosyltransferase involved in cell wall biosynthesis